LYLANNPENIKAIPQYPKIKGILSDFEKTELTPEESRYLTNLKDNYTELKTLEANLDQKDNSQKAIVSVLNNISRDLDELAEVQLSEGRNLTQRSKKSLGMNQLLSRIEIVFLIIIGILFLVIVFHRDKSDMKLVEDGS
jgi:hypothetical protein